MDGFEDACATAIAETADKAKQLLFDKEGNPKQSGHYLALLTLHTILQPKAAHQGLPDPLLVRWRSKDYVYMSAIAALLLQEARDGDAVSDQVLCNAAAIMLDATGGISDTSLRAYVIQRLSKDIPPPQKRGRGRSKTDNAYRDSVIAGWLIPPLAEKGFCPTRNEATDEECASSIVHNALNRIGISLSEKRIAEIWGKVSRHFA